MKIYFITQWYYPEPDGRVSSLAEELVSRGHEVIVITGFPNYPRGKLYEGYSIKWRQWENIKGVKVLRLPLFPDHSRSKIKRILNYASFCLSLFIFSPWYIKKPDVFWAYTPFVIFPVLCLKKIFKAPYVLEITDVWPDTIYATGMLKEGFLTKVLNGIAKIGYKHASAITVQNVGFKTRLIERSVDTDKLFVVENWADESVFFPVKYDHGLAKKYDLQSKFVVMFAGNMGIAQGLDNIVKSAELCKNLKDIVFVFIGDGVCLEATKKDVIEKKLKNVLFIDRKPLNEMTNFFSLANVLLVTLRDDPLFEITLPSKTQAYLASGKPIIIAKRGKDADLLFEKGCALKCEPDNPETLADSVKKIFNLSKDEQEKMGQNSLALYKEKYQKSKLVDLMESVLVNVN